MAVIKTAGALSLAVLLLPTATPPPSIKLSWYYPGDYQADGISFNVYETTNLALPFRFLTNVVETNCPLPILPGAHFFIVTASNAECGESVPATK